MDLYDIRLSQLPGNSTPNHAENIFEYRFSRVLPLPGQLGTYGSVRLMLVNWHREKQVIFQTQLCSINSVKDSVFSILVGVLCTTWNTPKNALPFRVT